MHSVYLKRRISALLLVALFTAAAAGIASADGGREVYSSPEPRVASPSPSPSAVPAEPTPVECRATAQELRCAGSLR